MPQREGIPHSQQRAKPGAKQTGPDIRKDMALTKADMAVRLHEELGLNKREAKDLVELFFEELRAALESGQQVKLSGFGNFDLRDKNRRPGRNPKTGEVVPITARRVVTFRAGQKLRERVEAHAGSIEQ
ncbi:MAG: integration host factor subunit alpha [Gammaproteobacteria bacterium]